MPSRMTAERLHAEITAFLHRDRLPEQRIRPMECAAIKEIHALYQKASRFDPWPGDKWRGPIGIERNPFLRQSKNLPLAALILSDPEREDEAFEKLLEAGYEEDEAISIIRCYNQSSELAEAE